MKRRNLTCESCEVTQFNGVVIPWDIDIDQIQEEEVYVKVLKDTLPQMTNISHQVNGHLMKFLNNFLNFRLFLLVYTKNIFFIGIL